MLRYRVWFLEEGKRFEDFVIAYGSNMDEVRIDAKEIIEGKGIKSYEILKWEYLGKAK